MNEKLKIDISIAERLYPLTVDPSQKENLLKASQRVDYMLKQFEQNYAVKDRQDLLAMCALQFATQVEQKNEEINNSNLQVTEKLKRLHSLLDKHL
ncbi:MULTISPECIES: cell division protein ZapA [Flavobacterium]|uniref:Cell division protein ZapA n=2 Tax=Flavobacterium TaxID=237 RepID=A0AA94JQH9_9FLAO|nr:MULTISPECIES: cell division protein ZapA [Flavobacterium]OXA82730.1 cell division protein ZapA [Flavobacterium columnare] [Flavobacterium columnare NBRC 100251 = ATCC 23463]AMA49563.1 cell division protein ZapA [Flavobacterium covae]AND63262.1 cell division protein ZapA [Flavobacterium covae]MCH4828848.1 cell division protein ZapA [Flavobacterium columnare]MCH4832102.1 cell division protein ZapA [Flavobacterium columnare]